jgi:hypothetical protein
MYNNEIKRIYFEQGSETFCAAEQQSSANRNDTCDRGTHPAVRQLADSEIFLINQCALLEQKVRKRREKMTDCNSRQLQEARS